MNLIQTIALLCLFNAQTSQANKQLACQKYYLNCLHLDARMFEPNAEEFAKCIEKRPESF